MYYQNKRRFSRPWWCFEHGNQHKNEKVSFIVWTFSPVKKYASVLSIVNKCSKTGTWKKHKQDIEAEAHQQAKKMAQNFCSLGYMNCKKNHTYHKSAPKSDDS